MENIFIKKLQQGFACLHATDTVPGLTFDPFVEKGLMTICKFKGRMENKPFIGLTVDFPTALSFWQKLPSPWEGVLDKLWPTSLSVVWKASSKAPNALVSKDGTICLRVPKLYGWFTKVLRELDFPLPTTSANKSMELSAQSWNDAKKLLQNIPNIFVPDREPILQQKEIIQLPSTIIKILDNGSFKMLRVGSITQQLIEENLK